MKKLLVLLSCICVSVVAAEVKAPAFFKDWDAETHFDFPMYKGNLKSKALEIKDDPTSETGKVVVLSFPNKYADIAKYKEWVFVGLHSPKTKGLGKGAILWTNVKQPGWNWYRISNKAKLAKDCYAYFFTTWILQMPLGAAADITFPEQKYEIWAKVKFTGPTFPQGKKDEQDAIYVERIVVKKVK